MAEGRAMSALSALNEGGEMSEGRRKVGELEDGMICGGGGEAKRHRKEGADGVLEGGEGGGGGCECGGNLEVLWLDRRPREGAARGRRRTIFAAAAGTILASCALFVASSGGDEGLAGPGELLDRGMFSHAMHVIQEGEKRARRGGFMHAASDFLKAKDLWKASGERGWESAQSLADAAVDKC